jgi:DNA topoisomerase VI subunit B
LDFSHRISSREAYISPTRGAQGNALKTIVAMPFVLDGEQGRVEIAARGVRHKICLRVDRIRQEPVIDHRKAKDQFVKIGTFVRVHSPNSARSILENAAERFLQIMGGYAFVNPHLSLTWDWFGKAGGIEATSVAWKKWLPRDKTSPHWYTVENLERLVSAYLAHDADKGHDRMIREFVAEFAGLSGSGKQKQVLEETGQARSPLSSLGSRSGLDRTQVTLLLDSMKRHTRPIKAAAIGVVGKDHLAERFQSLGCEMATFQYRKKEDLKDGLPSVVEVAFAWRPYSEQRRLITGVNWSPAIPGTNPFRKLGGESLDSLLERGRAGEEEPVVVFLHLACPRVEYTDRGKSAMIFDA